LRWRRIAFRIKVVREVCVESKISALVKLLKEAPRGVLIQTHDIPDPDAIASAFGLQVLLSNLGVASKIVHERVFEKVDARRMVELLGIQLSIASESILCDGLDRVVIVDAQNGNANIVNLDCVTVAAIDHHPLRIDASYRFTDVRPNVGACSSIIAEYFFESGSDPTALVATALYYGILVDTDNMTRGVSDLDAEMFYRLRKLVDLGAIQKLRSSQITLRDLAMYAKAFDTVEVYSRMGFVRLEDADSSLVGSASDIVLSVDEVDIAIAHSIRDDGVRISVRSSDRTVSADDLVRALVAGTGFGGGHPHMAGGFIPSDRIPSGKTVNLLIKHRAIAYLETLGR
jgi:nanoRNase/pAp phosphatase (c-di-AMP/oligoRNAs hydrolase)